MGHHYDDVVNTKTGKTRIEEIEDEKVKLQEEKEKIIKGKEIKNKKAHDLSVQLKKLKVPFTM